MKSHPLLLLPSVFLFQSFGSCSSVKWERGNSPSVITEWVQMKKREIDDWGKSRFLQCAWMHMRTNSCGGRLEAVPGLHPTRGTEKMVWIVKSAGCSLEQFPPLASQKSRGEGWARCPQGGRDHELLGRSFGYRGCLLQLVRVSGKLGAQGSRVAGCVVVGWNARGLAMLSVTAPCAVPGGPSAWCPK